MFLHSLTQINTSYKFKQRKLLKILSIISKICEEFIEIIENLKHNHWFLFRLTCKGCVALAVAVETTTSLFLFLVSTFLPLIGLFGQLLLLCPGCLQS